MESLFEWVKLDAGEQLFILNIWISMNCPATLWLIGLLFRNSNFEYEIEIPETEYSIRIDPNAYTRILNNLLQNVIVHSKGNQITLSILENQDSAVITVKDNGIGISSVDLPHILKECIKPTIRVPLEEMVWACPLSRSSSAPIKENYRCQHSRLWS